MNVKETTTRKKKNHTHCDTYKIRKPDGYDMKATESESVNETYG